MLDPFIEAIILLITGLGAGTLGSLIGIGGGFIMTPVQTFMGFAPAQISSTTLFAVTFTGASSTISYIKQRKIRYQVGLKMAAFAFPGAIIGAFVSSVISMESFKIYFGILLMLSGIYIFFSTSYIKRRQSRLTGYHNKVKFRVLFCFGAFGAGIISSLFGIGGGIVFVPLLVFVLGMTLTAATPTSQLALLITSLVGTVTHVLLGHPDYFHAASLSAGAFVGGLIGAKLLHKVRESVLRKLFSVSLMAVAIKFISDFVNGPH